MTQIVSVFRKDARHLWPQILVFVALALLGALVDPTYTYRKLSTVESLIWTALPLACWNLIVAAIHEERLPGDRQYWLTRPYSRGGLFAAKALFVGAFVNLPVFLIQAGILAAVGIPPLHHLSPLLWRQIFFLVFLVLPAAALSAITRNLKQVFLAALLIVVPLFLLTLAPYVKRGPASDALASFVLRPLTGEFWLRTLFMAAAVIAGSAAVLILQYWRRATALSRTLLAVTIVLALLAGGLATPERAYGVQTLLSPARLDSSAVRISYHQGASRAHLTPNGHRGLRVRLEIPVRLDGVSRGMEMLSVKMEGIMQSSGPASRNENRHESVKVEGELTGPTTDAVLAVYIEPALFERLKSAADLRGRVELTVFERSQTFSSPKSQVVVVPGVGVCRTMPDFEGSLSIVCYTPFPRVSLALEFPGGGRHWIVSRRTVDVPLPTSAGFQPIEKFTSPTSFGSLRELEGIQLVTEKRLATIERSLDFKDIRLPVTAVR
jgi:hypothetical protein